VRVKYWEIIADNRKKAGWSCGNGQRFIYAARMKS